MNKAVTINTQLNGRQFDELLEWEAKSPDGTPQAYIKVYGDGTIIINDGVDQKQTSFKGIIEALTEKRQREGWEEKK